ncbi:RidA family protein [Bosea caraganae]|uniref:RidA family protein n=1 Tax=Bosea caraganae TaxID=2763117 RepID=A0A370L8P6_9HYPH|nr:RidA family protein [Bosea caraganae]RDJ26760.1 RidA family protein [Bosea caraganae]RDJ30647.1 RidA family protein [Bosea caraganae]
MSALETILSPDVPAPAGHYAQAVGYKDLVFVSGQLAPRPDGSHTAEEPFAVQARQALDNLLAILRAGGCGPQDVVKVTAYLVGAGNWPEFNRIYAEAFGAHKPARSVVPVPELHYGYLIEIEAIAVRRG